jgi:hypothetical protein
VPKKSPALSKTRRISKSLAKRQGQERTQRAARIFKANKVQNNERQAKQLSNTPNLIFSELRACSAAFVFSFAFSR